MDHKRNSFDFLLGLILIITSKTKIIIGTIINSFWPSEINFVIKFANKKYPNNIDSRLSALSFQDYFKKPKNNKFNESIKTVNLVFCIIQQIFKNLIKYS